MTEKLNCPDCGNNQLEVGKGMLVNQIAVICTHCGSLFLIKDRNKSEIESLVNG